MIVANPAPMAYGVVATTARAINELKRRPAEQNVAVSVHDRSQWRELEPAVDLPPGALRSVVQLLRMRLTVLLPVGGTVPPPRWMAPALRDGRLAVFNGYWPALDWLWQRFPRLYGSSANVTGEPAVTSAAAAMAMFGADCVLAEADTETDDSDPRWSSTMVSLDATGRISLHRSGAQDQVCGAPAHDFIKELARTVGLRPAPKGTTP